LTEIDPQFLHFENMFSAGGQFRESGAALRSTGSASGLSKKTLSINRPQPRVGSAPVKTDDPNFEPDDTSHLQVGDAVIHQRFGKGNVLQMEGSGDNRKATIEFGEAGKKVLVLKFAKLKIILP
jgi:DNA helicase-2/ATP-dependent DNA helicase PcrA